MFSAELINRFRFYLLAGMVFAIPLVFLPTQYDMFEWPKLSIFWAGLIGLILCYILEQKKPSSTTKSFFNLSNLFLGLTIIYLLATLTSISPIESLLGSVDRSFGVITIVSFFVFYLVTKNINLSKKDFDFLLKIIIFDTLVIGILAILQKFFGWGLFGAIKTHGIVRPYSTFGHPNYLGAYLAISFPFLLYFINTTKTLWARIFTGLTIIVSLFALYLTLNRGGWLACFAGSLLFFILYLIKTKSKHLTRNIILTTVIHSLILTSFFTGIWGFGGKERQDDLTVDSGSIYLRIQEAKFAWSKIIEHPILGYGPETYYYLSLNRIIPEKEKQIDGAIADRVHNWVLDQWVSIGVFGLILWLGIYWQFIKQSWINYTQKSSLISLINIASLFAYAIIVQFHFDTTIILFLVFLNFILINRETEIAG